MRLLLIGIFTFASVSAAQSQPSASTNSPTCSWMKGEEPIPLSQSLQAAESGNPFCQYMLGQRYEKGIGAENDYVKAASWYQKASEQGLAAAQWSLGQLYAENKGEPRDFEKAYFWLYLASSAYSVFDERSLQQ